MYKNVKKIQGYKVVLKVHNASSLRSQEISSQIFRMLITIDLSSSGNLIIKQLLDLNLNADYHLLKKPAKRIIDIYCK